MQIELLWGALGHRAPLLLPVLRHPPLTPWKEGEKTRLWFFIRLAFIPLSLPPSHAPRCIQAMPSSLIQNTI